MSNRDKLLEVKVGAFALAALLILVIGSLWIAGAAVFGVRHVSYRVLMHDSGGIAEGDRVRVAGVPVGKIRRIELQPEQEWPVVFDVTLRRDITMRADGSARIASTGLLGSSFLQIEPGNAAAPVLPPGGEIRGEAGFDMTGALAQLGDIAQNVGTLLDQASGMLAKLDGRLDPTLERMDAMLAEENAENLRSVLATASETLEDAGPRITAVLARMESLSRTADASVAGMPQMMQRIETLVEEVRAALGPDAARLGGTLSAAESSLVHADEVLSVLAADRHELDATVRDMRETSANLKQLSQALKERPFSLVRIKAAADRKPGQGVE